MNKAKKIRVGIFFGGKSAEHEVSLQSARNVLEALDTSKFEPVLIGIDRDGSWHIQNTPLILKDGRLADLSIDPHESPLSLLPGKGELLSLDSGRSNSTIDVAFPILHGPLGEDGSIQGFLELANIPYVGPGVLGSAVGMDKDVMKRLLRDAGIPVAPFLTFTASTQHLIKNTDVFEQLGTPVFVKPANMGSSVGVSRATSAEELEKAIKLAFEYDTKIIIEQAIVGEEIECSILGNNQPEASVLGRITPRENDFYSYDAKYIDDKGAILEIPADLPKEVSDEARQLAIKTFQVLGCEGMSRVDMFITRDYRILVNEINTIPGFTKISMYPKLWEATGVPYPELISRLINLAIERHTQRSNLKTSS